MRSDLQSPMPRILPVGRCEKRAASPRARRATVTKDWPLPGWAGAAGRSSCPPREPGGDPPSVLRCNTWRVGPQRCCCSRVSGRTAISETPSNGTRLIPHRPRHQSTPPSICSVPSRCHRTGPESVRRVASVNPSSLVPAANVARSLGVLGTAGGRPGSVPNRAATTRMTTIKQVIAICATAVPHFYTVIETMTGTFSTPTNAPERDHGGGALSGRPSHASGSPRSAAVTNDVTRPRLSRVAGSS